LQRAAFADAAINGFAASVELRLLTATLAVGAPKDGVPGIGVPKHLWIFHGDHSMVASARLRTPSSAAPEIGHAETLAIQACDDTDSLREVLHAYTCIEKLIEPAELGDTDRLHPTRTELAALLGLVNLEMNRRLDEIDATLQSMRAGLDGRTTGAAPAS
jgi:hypothetical protein